MKVRKRSGGGEAIVKSVDGGAIIQRHHHDLLAVKAIGGKRMSIVDDGWPRRGGQDLIEEVFMVESCGRSLDM